MWLVDSLQNFVTALGTSADKHSHNQFTASLVDAQQLHAAYSGNWISRKIVDIPAEDSTRAWRNWQAEPQQITALEELERAHAIPLKTLEALRRARLYGGAALVIGVDGAGNWEDPLELDRVKRGALKYVHLVGRDELAEQDRTREVTDPLYGRPKFYTFGTARIHPSRVALFTGAERLDPSPGQSADCWGDSVLQSLDEPIKSALLSAQGVASLVDEASVNVIQVPNFMNSIKTDEYRTRLIERFRLAMLGKSINRTLMLDKEETWNRNQVNFSQLPEIIKTFLNIVAAASDIPATRFLGQSPGGLNSTGESDIRNYYDNVSSDQRNKITPALAVLDEVLIRSAIGQRPPEIHYNWAPLWQQSAVEKADVFSKTATAVRDLRDTALVDDAVLAAGVKNWLIEDGTLPGIESAYDDLELGELDETPPTDEPPADV